MSNFVPTGKPAFNTKGVSSFISNEFVLVATAVNSKADTSRFNGGVWTGTQDFTGATVTVPTPTTALAAANKSYADAIGQSAALPSQTGNALKFVRTDGATASWAYPFLTLANVAGTTQAAVAGREYLLSNVAITTVTVPASPADGDVFAVNILNGLFTNVLAFGAQTVISLSGSITGNMEIDLGGGLFIYSTSLGKWVMH